MTAQAASPTFTHVYAALVAIVNTKFPQIGELIIKRVIVNFKKGYRRNDKVSIMKCVVMSHYVSFVSIFVESLYGFSQLSGSLGESASGKCM